MNLKASRLTVAANDMKTARGDVSPASLEHLDIVLNGNDLSLYDPMELAAWVKCLQDGATVSVTIPGTDAADLSPIHSSFTLAGLKGVSERKEADGNRVFTASLPSGVKSSGAKPIALAKTSAVSISLDDDGLIDEDALLGDEDQLLTPPPAMGANSNAADDCGGRTACDNCTCGRADQEADEKKKDGANKSSCGKCGLGDAFRCVSIKSFGNYNWIYSFYLPANMISLQNSAGVLSIPWHARI